MCTGFYSERMATRVGKNCNFLKKRKVGQLYESLENRPAIKQKRKTNDIAVLKSNQRSSVNVGCLPGNDS